MRPSHARRNDLVLKKREQDQPSIAEKRVGHSEIPFVLDRYALGIFLAALVVRCANLLLINDTEIFSFIEDSALYWTGAETWLATGEFAVRSVDGLVMQTERVPGYFLFLMVFQTLFSEPLTPVLFAQAFVDSATCVVIAMIGGNIDRSVGIASGLIAAVSPNLIVHSALILNDTLFLFIFCMCIFYCIRFMSNGTLVNAFAAALCCGLAIMTRPTLQFFPFVFIFAAPAIVYLHGGHRSHMAAAIAVVLIGASIPLAPLVARNLTQFGSASLTAQAGSHALFWITSHAIRVETGRPFDEIATDLSRKYHVHLAEKHMKRAEMNSFEESRERTVLALRELSKLPVGTLIRAWGQGALLNVLTPAVLLDPRVRALNQNSYSNSTGATIRARAEEFLKNSDSAYLLLFAMSSLGSAVAAVLSLFGFYFLFRRNRWAAAFAAFIVAYFLLLMGPIGSPKYRLPLEPVLIVLEAITLIAVYRAWRNRVGGLSAGLCRSRSNSVKDR